MLIEPPLQPMLRRPGESMRSVEIEDIPLGASPNAKKLRAYASRLMAFAFKAVGDGDTGFAECLAARASECLDHAQAMERRLSSRTELVQILFKKGGKECGGCVPVNRVSASECAQCGADMIAPTWSEHLSNRCVRNVWSCEACGYEFEDTIYLSARGQLDLPKHLGQLSDVHRNPPRNPDGRALTDC